MVNERDSRNLRINASRWGISKRFSDQRAERGGWNGRQMRPSPQASNAFVGTRRKTATAPDGASAVVVTVRVLMTMARPATFLVGERLMIKPELISRIAEQNPICHHARKLIAAGRPRACDQRREGEEPKPLSSDFDDHRRLVTLRREGDDFAVVFYPQDIIAFRNKDPQKLRKMCAFLRWKIISDAALDEGKKTSRPSKPRQCA
jgi:hypothetical protein